MIYVGNIYAGLNSNTGPMTVNTGNGLSGDGSIATPVILGGTFTQSTLISFGLFDLELNAITAAGDNFDIFMDGQTYQLYGSNQDGSQSFIQLDAGIGPGITSLILGVSNISSQVKQFEFNVSNGVGVVITDNIDNIGITGDSLYPLNGDPNQYIQAGNLPGAAPVSENLAETSTLVVPIHTAGASNEFVRINAAALFTTFFAGATLDCSIDYQDILGNARNVVLGTINSVDPSSFPSVVIAVKAGQDIDLSVVFTGIGGNVFNAYGSVDVLGTIT